MSFTIVILILIWLPILNVSTTRKRRKRPDSAGKIRAYGQIFFWYSLISVLILLQYRPGEIFHPKYHLDFTFVWQVIALAVALYLLLSNLIPLLLFNRSEVVRNSLFAEWEKHADIFPQTLQEQTLFVFVALFIGVGEEIMFRGFLYNFAHEQTGLTVSWSFAAVALIFAAGHFMQGLDGVIHTGLFGLLAGILFMKTGSLLLPILLHVLFDLKILFVTRRIQAEYRQD